LQDLRQKTTKKARTKTHKSVKPYKQYNTGIPIAAKAAAASITGMQAASKALITTHTSNKAR